MAIARDDIVVVVDIATDVESTRVDESRVSRRRVEGKRFST